MSQLSTTYLFGGDKPWSPLDWTSSDDRVRGGSSYSALTCSLFDPVAEFHGNLDIKTLGGAGFASQRTTGEDRTWDLSSYDGLVLDVVRSDGKQYTVILKDELLPKTPNGREQSTVSWEYDFKESDKGSAEERGKGSKIFVKWEEFKPTYRGREKKDAEPLDLKSVKRVSLMMRSFFGTQEGDFTLSVRSISVAKKASNPDILGTTEPYRDDPSEKVIPRSMNKMQNQQDLALDSVRGQQGWFGWLSAFCSGKT